MSANARALERIHQPQSTHRQCTQPPCHCRCRDASPLPSMLCSHTHATSRPPTPPWPTPPWPTQLANQRFVCVCVRVVCRGVVPVRATCRAHSGAHLARALGLGTVGEKEKKGAPKEGSSRFSPSGQTCYRAGRAAWAGRGGSRPSASEAHPAPQLRDAADRAAEGHHRGVLQE